MNKDIIAVEFFLNSELKPDDIKFSLELLAWTPKGLKLFVNFTDPLQIS